MSRTPYIVVFIAAAITGAILESCGGSGSITGGNDPIKRVIDFPAFTVYSTDLSDLTEGTAANPLKLAWSPNCVFGGGFPACDSAPGPIVFRQTNSLSTSRDPARWRYVINMEDAWDPTYNTGPPGQSLPLTAAPIIWRPSEKSVELGFDLSDGIFCRGSNVPYVAATFIRGVQGDTEILLPWGKQGSLVFYTRLEKTLDAAFVRHVYLWLHFRDKAGNRYMALLWLYRTGDGTFRMTWNWPEKSSYYFAGMGNGQFMNGGDGCDAFVKHLEVNGTTAWTIDVEGLGACRFPEFTALKPDLLGFEWAIEGGSSDYLHPQGLRNMMKLTLLEPSLVANQ